MKESSTKIWAQGAATRLWFLKTGALSMLLLSLSMSLAWAQGMPVNGKVIDELTNEGLPGVSILIKGTGTGTVTDMDGNYKLTVPGSDAVLVFSYIGYIREEIPVGTQSTINVSLAPDLEQMSEVVVVGYGTQKKEDITGAVAVVDAKEMKKVAAGDVSQLLQGRTPGVAVTSDGQPGAVPNVRIRGIGTFGAQQPLYVIDGVLLENPPRDFNPNDVESMQVLKDASAAAIYGSRGANGVIIITTRQGRKNTPLRVEYNGYYGVDQVWQRVPVTNRVQYQMLQNETQLQGGQTIAPANDPDSPDFIDDIDTDWQEEGLKLGSRQNHNVVLTGGGEATTYNISLDFFGNQGTFVGNGPSYDRYSGRLNTVSEKGRFRAGISLYYAHSMENSLTFRDDILLGGRPPLIGDLITAIPTLPVYDPNRLGGFGGTSSTIERGIVLNAIGANSLIENTVTVDRTFGSGWGEFALIQGGGHSLKYKLNLGYDRTIAEDFAFVPAFDLGYFFTNDIARMGAGFRSYTTALIENTLHYEKTFGEKHAVSAVVGQTYQENDFTELASSAQGFATPYIKNISLGANRTTRQNFGSDALASYLGRINYAFDDRYLLTASIRRDASSKFAPENRVGVYPSVALGWKLHNEQFFSLPTFINEFKLRGSYGQLGNQSISNYEFIPSINPTVPYNFGGVAVGGSVQTQINVEDIRWETKTMSNVGFDAAFFDGRFDLTAEYYRSTTDDILVRVPIPNTTGANNTPFQNAGSLRNSGVELQVGYHKFKGDFTFDISANAYTLKNRVLALGSDEPIYGVGARTEVGREIGEHFGYDVLGIFQTEEEVEAHAFQEPGTAPGDVKFRDVDGDGVITEADRIYLGSGIPNIYYGLNFTARYKGFDFTLFASGMGDYLINSRQYRDLMHTQDYLNYHEDALGRWTPENPSTTQPRLVAGDPNRNMRDSNREGWLQDGTHLRINTLSLGYTLPEGLIKGLTSTRIYTTAQNLYTFQAYKGYNPDFTAGTFNPGFDFGSFPRPRTILFGVQVAF